MAFFEGLKINDIVYTAREMNKSFFESCKYVVQITGGDGRLLVGGFTSNTAFEVAGINKTAPPYWVELKPVHSSGLYLKLAAHEFAENFQNG